MLFLRTFALKACANVSSIVKFQMSPENEVTCERSGGSPKYLSKLNKQNLERDCKVSVLHFYQSLDIFGSCSIGTNENRNNRRRN